MATASIGQRSAEFSSKVSEACEAADKFVQVFYETLDKRRQLISGFYSETSFVVWNGHTKSGSADISTFYQSLPGTSHTLLSYDCQPAPGIGQTTVMVVCEGVVQFDGQPNEETFTQNFLLTKQGEVWKIGSDCFRFLDHQS